MTLAVVAKSAKLGLMFALGGGAMDDGYGYLADFICLVSSLAS